MFRARRYFLPTTRTAQGTFAVPHQTQQTTPDKHKSIRTRICYVKSLRHVPVENSAQTKAFGCCHAPGRLGRPKRPKLFDAPLYTSVILSLISTHAAFGFRSLVPPFLHKGVKTRLARCRYLRTRGPRCEARVAVHSGRAVRCKILIINNLRTSWTWDRSIGPGFRVLRALRVRPPDTWPPIS